MKTVKILNSDHTSLIEGGYEWLLIQDGEMLAMHFTRTEARNDKANRGTGSVVKVSDIEFEIIKPAPTALDLLAALEKQEAAKKEEQNAHPYGYETHGHDNCPHCGIHLDNGILQAGDEIGSGKRGERRVLETEKFEFVCLACNQEFGPEITAKKVHTPITHVSTIENPCKMVWGIAIDMKKANPEVKRGAVLAECVKQGIAYYTARTQYQAWLSVRKEEEATRLANEAKSK